MDDRFASHRDIIDAWPGLPEFAQDIDVPYGTAKAMRRRGSIRAEYFVFVVAGAERRNIAGVTYELLARLAASRICGTSEAGAA